GPDATGAPLPLSSEKQRACPSGTAPQTGRIETLVAWALDAPSKIAVRARTRQKNTAQMAIRLRAGSFDGMVLLSGVYYSEEGNARPIYPTSRTANGRLPQVGGRRRPARRSARGRRRRCGRRSTDVRESRPSRIGRRGGTSRSGR